ncbi:hypothetical protein CEJ45_01700 [Herbaspirillum aquaticum]|uniref:Uncharacterized protein n=1 Tax=Herbaspirillum aquaticum TaxID=568783 RepID=A0A225T011_9BURK|nr:hypothetical protein CEJ45_01700 [Herbaspirillum aquaticum]
MKITLLRCSDVAPGMTKPWACGKVATKQTANVAGRMAIDEHTNKYNGSKDKRQQSAAGHGMAYWRLAYQQVGAST